MSVEAEPPSKAASEIRQLRYLWLGLVVAWIIVAASSGAVTDLTHLHLTSLPETGLWASAGIRGFVALPLFVAAALVVLLAPGILGTLALGGDEDWAPFAVKAFGLSYFIRVATHALATPLVAPWGFGDFAIVEALTLLFLTGLLTYRVRSGRAVRSPLADSRNRRRAVVTFLGPAVLVVIMLPFFFWQDFSGDGLEALDIGRSLSEYLIPRFMNGSGFYGFAMGMNAMAYPVHWFSLLIGPAEAAARLPFLIYLPVLWLGTIALAEYAAPRRLVGAEDATIGTALLAMAALLGFNGSYDLYAMELASPGSFVTLTITCMLSTILMLVRGERSWFVGFLLLTYFARPTGLFLVMLLVLSAVLVPRVKRLTWVNSALIGLIACIVVSQGFERLVVPALSGGLSPDYPSASMLSRLRFLRFDNFTRIFQVAAGGGFIPLAALLFVRRQDWVAKVVTFVTAFYFLLFYFPAFGGLHHIAPAMVLPVVVLWRLWIQTPARPQRWGLALLGALLAIYMAIPQQMPTLRHVRVGAAQVANEVGDYMGEYPSRREAAEARSLIKHGLLDPRLVGSEKVRAVAPVLVPYYSDRLDVQSDGASVILLESAHGPPHGTEAFFEEEGFSLFVRDPSHIEDFVDLLRFPRDVRSRWFDVAPENLHGFLGAPAGEYQLDLTEFPVIWRFF